EAVDLLNKAREATPAFFVPLKEAELCALIHRHVYARAVELLDGKAFPTDRLGFCAQIVGGRALVRFKHLDGDLAPRTYPTEQQRHLDIHQYTDDMMVQLAEDGLGEPPTMLTCGYRMSATWDKLSQVAIVCRFGGKHLYH